MTTPEDKAGGAGKSSAKAEAADGRVRRPQSGRGPNRSSTAAKGAAPADAASPASPASATQPAQDQKVSDAVAHAVKVGYDVIAENIRQGREAAARFRQGEYSLRDAPGDLEIAALRLLHLARELSTTTFDICERLLKELGAQRPPDDRAADLPAFRPAPSAPAPPAKPSSPPADSGAMKVTVRFEGAPAAISHTASLTRPRRPTAPTGISAAPLAPAEAGAAPIAGVRFEMDASVEGIVAIVSVPKGQATGVYSGLVHAEGDPIPLGVLTVEIPK